VTIAKQGDRSFAARRVSGICPAVDDAPL